MTLTGDAKRAYQREWMRRRRAAWFSEQVCHGCGTSKDLELHHIDPKLKVSHKIWSWSQGRRDIELEKCVALCESCHARVSADQASSTIPWGVVEQLRRRHAAGESGEKLALELRIGHGHAYRIIRGEARKFK